jgi:hypothetical protein
MVNSIPKTSRQKGPLLVACPKAAETMAVVWDAVTFFEFGRNEFAASMSFRIAVPLNGDQANRLMHR